MVPQPRPARLRAQPAPTGGLSSRYQVFPRQRRGSPQHVGPEPLLQLSVSSGKSASLPRPLLDVGPVPDRTAAEVGDRLRKVGIALPPAVDDLVALDVEALGDLRCAHELVHAHPPHGHGVNATPGKSTGGG